MFVNKLYVCDSFKHDLRIVIDSVSVRNTYSLFNEEGVEVYINEIFSLPKENKNYKDMLSSYKRFPILCEW